MTTPRIYFPQSLQEQGLYVLGEGYQHYLRHVLRLGVGDALNIFDGSGNDYEALVEKLAVREISVRIIKRTAVDNRSRRLTLAQALPKGSKMDGIVEKATELGVARIIPFNSLRSVPKWSAGKAAERVSRWRKIAVEASRRSCRSDIPAIEEVVPYEAMLAMAGVKRPQLHGPGQGQAEEETGEEPWRRRGSGRAAEDGAPMGRIIFWEEGGRNIKALLQDDLAGQRKDCFFVVGPEGGFAGEEVKKARDMGFAVAGLGKQVLRVETASLVILAIMQYEGGIFSGADDLATN